MSERDENRSYHFGYFHPQTSRLANKKPADNVSIKYIKPRSDSSSFTEERTIKHVSTNSYFYDERGKIKLNPIPLKVAFYSHTFHEPASGPNHDSDNQADRSLDDLLHKRSPTAYKKHERKPTSIEPKVQTSHGSRGTWHRELFIMQDGTIISENSPPSGFKYILSYKKNQTRKKLQQEFQDFLLYATQKFKCSDKFRFAFSRDGKILHSLYELPQGQSVAFVGHSRYFKGFHIESSETTSYRSRSSFRSKASIKSRDGDTSFDAANYKSHEKSRGKSRSSVQSCNPKPKSEAKIWDDPEAYSKTQIISQPTPIESDQLEDIIKQYSSNDRTFTEIAPRKVYSAISSISPDKHLIQSSTIPISDYQNRIIQKVICKIASKTADIYKASVKLRIRLSENLVRVDRLYPHLTKSTLQQLEARYKFSRADIHKLYARFKTLLLVAVALNPDYDISTGIDKQTFINGLRGAGTDGVKLISRVFDTIDYSRNGYLDWEEFLNAMNLFVFSNLDQKIDLFFTAYDPTGFNKVSFKDISELCKLQIKRAAHTDIQDDLSQSFAQFLFDFAGARKDQGLSKNELKSALNKESTDMNLVEMFCSFNFLNKFLASKYEDIEYLLLEHNNSSDVI